MSNLKTGVTTNIARIEGNNLKATISGVDTILAHATKRYDELYYWHGFGRFGRGKYKTPADALRAAARAIGWKVAASTPEPGNIRLTSREDRTPVVTPPFNPAEWTRYLWNSGRLYTEKGQPFVMQYNKRTGIVFVADHGRGIDFMCQIGREEHNPDTIGRAMLAAYDTGAHTYISRRRREGGGQLISYFDQMLGIFVEDIPLDLSL